MKTAQCPLDFSFEKRIMWDEVVESGKDAGTPGVHELKEV